MKLSEAIDLIRPAVPAPGGAWADFGAGEGLFTRALARLLGSGGRVYALDRDPRALSSLRRLAGDPGAGSAEIVAMGGDFRELDDLDELPRSGLEGAVFANALHFTPDLRSVLEAVCRRLGPDGRVVVVEYATRRPNPWVPYPVSIERLASAARAANFARPVVVAEHPSRYGGTMYCAVLDHPHPSARDSARAAGPPHRDD